MLRLEDLPGDVIEDGRALLVRDIAEYVTAAIVAEFRDRAAEVAVSCGGTGRLEVVGAVAALIEAAGNRASARLVERIALPKGEPGKTHLVIVA